MKTAYVIAAAALLMAGPALSSGKRESHPVPNDWREWKNSSHADDATLVKSIEKMKWWDLCAAWGPEARKKTTTRRGHAVRDKLLNDQMINGIDLGAVSGRRPEVGQTICGVYAVLGLPDDVNTTEGQSSVAQQLVYRSRGIYIRARSTPNNHNGTATSISY